MTALFPLGSFTNTLTLQGKGEGADTFLHDAHKPHHWRRCLTLPESGLGWQFPSENLYHRYLANAVWWWCQRQASSCHCQPRISRLFSGSVVKFTCKVFPASMQLTAPCSCSVLFSIRNTQLSSWEHFRHLYGFMSCIPFKKNHRNVGAKTIGGKKADQELLLECKFPGGCSRNTAHWLFGAITCQPPARSWSTATNRH